MKVLVTGSDGYIGAVLCEMLVARGHDVLGLDTGYFDGCDFLGPPAPVPSIKKDIRLAERDDVAGCDAVMHLAALSNDPLGDLAPALTESINTGGSVRLARLARDAGVPRFLFSSSCSMYGEGSGKGLTEESAFRPQTAYAQSKVDVEAALSAMADGRFSPTFLRNATACGVSPRMRFDLVVNNLVGWAWTTGAIRMTSDGTPWRPIVHIRDIAKAFACALEAPRERVHNEAFNVGATDHNFQIREIAERVRRQFPDCEVTFGESGGDTRTYHVDCSKIHERLDGFSPLDYSLDDAIAELKGALDRAALTEERFRSRLYTRLKQIEHLQETGRLDGELFWRTA
ncbi:MAG: SDR family oxidoreductase [Candidatus Hydrogenedentes bacterium]|nr:SDR family oxidoreductase [Candidatus Hydrogenedentota bacterium]